MHYQIWARDEKIGDPLPVAEALDALRDQVTLDEDPNDAPPYFLLPVGYPVPDEPRGW